MNEWERFEYRLRGALRELPSIVNSDRSPTPARAGSALVGFRAWTLVTVAVTATLAIIFVPGALRGQEAGTASRPAPAITSTQTPPEPSRETDATNKDATVYAADAFSALYGMDGFARVILGDRPDEVTVQWAGPPPAEVNRLVEKFRIEGIVVNVEIVKFADARFADAMRQISANANSGSGWSLAGARPIANYTTLEVAVQLEAGSQLPPAKLFEQFTKGIPVAVTVGERATPAG